MPILKQSIKTGFSFGLTSGVITTLGLLIGLASGGQPQIVVLGGILVIAVSDALSDALGIHISEESNEKRTDKEVWESTITTFLSKLIVSGSFIVPVIFLPVFQAAIASIAWGIFLVSVFSFVLAKMQNRSAMPVIFEHLIITVIVIIATYYIGQAAATLGYKI